MKRMPVTGNEQVMPEGEQIISTTDLKGRITYVNQVFCDVSGFTEAELLGKAHNIVRHPDVPVAAFENLWQAMKSDQPWRGIVKNRCKNGDHYWVDAYVTPLYEGGRKVGYQSVRTQPTAQMVSTAQQVYDLANTGRAAKHLRLRSLTRQSWLMAGVVMLASFGALAVLGADWQQLLVALIAQCALLGVMFRLLLPVKQLTGRARQVAQNPLTQLMYCSRMDEAGEIELAMRMNEARKKTVLGRLEDIAQSIGQVVDITEASIQQSNDGIGRQEKETDAVADAMNQMVSATHAIADNTSDTSRSSQSLYDQTGDGRENLNNTMALISDLSQDVIQASESARNLQAHAEQIGTVVTVISEIADQTNLLALNAAIEAARAGDQGRGFAVVSDEVRTLASRTQHSTLEIREVIEKIQQSVAQAVETMEAGRERAERSVNVVRSTDEMFAQVQQEVRAITQRCVEVAQSAERQNAVVDEIGLNVDSIRELSHSNQGASQRAADASLELRKTIAQLDSMVRAFDQ